MTNEMLFKNKERAALLKDYSKRTIFNADADDFDVLNALISFDCKSLPILCEKLVFVTDRFVSFKARDATLSGLNIGPRKKDASSFEERLQASATRVGCSYQAAYDYWDHGVDLVSGKFDVGMRLYAANSLIPLPTTSPEATAALAWLMEEFVEAHREK